MSTGAKRHWDAPGDSSQGARIFNLAIPHHRGSFARPGGGDRIVFLGAAFITVVMVTLAAVLLFSNREHESAVGASTRIAPQPTEATVDVLVPIRTIEPGEEITPSLLSAVRKPQVAVPGNAILSYAQVNGRFARAFLPAFYPFTADMISERRPMNEVIRAIPDGYRAVTISVNATSSVEGWARAGANVDVQWVTDIRGERSAKRLVENARILSAERRVEANQDPNEPIPTTVTLLVLEKDAQKISLAASSGHLVLLLRGSRDAAKGSSGAGAITLSDLIGDHQQSDGKVEGTVRVRGPNGTVEEFVLKSGKFVRADDANTVTVGSK